ncbi:Sterol-sensing domain, partial [Trinorchestia longiramus]
IFEHLTPCTIITPLDCFWEGSLLLGPRFPVTVPGLGAGIRWSNLNPSKLVKKIEQVQDKTKHFPLASFVEFLKRAGITTGYQEKPCLDPSDPDCPASAPNKGSSDPVDVGAHVTGGCYGFAGRYMHWPEHLIVGATTKNKTGHIVRGEALQSIVQLMGSKNLYDYWHDDWKVHNIDWTQEKAEHILNVWMEKFMKKVESESEVRAAETAPYKLLPFSDASLGSLIQNFSELSIPKVVIGYGVMLVYTVVVLCRPWKPRSSQTGLGISGLLLVAFCVAAGMGFCALLGLPFTAASTQVLPFLALGLSLDNVFLVLHTAAQVATEAAASGLEVVGAERTKQVGDITKRCGVPILMSSACTALGFTCAAIIPVPALRSLCFQAAILLVVNAAAALLVLPALVSLDLRRRGAQQSDVFSCFSAPAESPTHVEAGRSSDTICCLPQHATTTSALPISTSNTRKPAADVSEKASTGDLKCDTPRSQKWTDRNTNLVLSPSVDSLGSTYSLVGETFGVRNFIFKFFSKAWNGYVLCVSSEKCRAVGFILLMASIATSAWGVSCLRDGLSLTALVPRGSPEATFLEAQQKHFSIYHMFVVTKGHFEYPRHQKLLHDYHAAFTRVPYILKDDNGGLPDSWLASFRDWLLGLQKAFDKDWERGCITADRWHSNASDDGVMGYKLLVQTGHVDHPVDRSLVTQTRLVDAEGVINPDAFYTYLSAWVTNDAMAYGASQADLRPEPRRWFHDRYNEHDLKIPKSSPLVYAQMSFFLRHVNTTESITDMITQVRLICEKFNEQGLPNFPKGIPFTFWEQYIHLRFFLVLSLVSVVVGVFLIVSVLLLNAWAAAVVVLTLSLIAFQLAGMLGILGVNLSAAPCVMVVAAVGVGMQYVAPVVLGYLTSVGSRRRRVGAALHHMAPPVLNGAVSTLLAALMLIFSEFDFIRRCFFYVIACLVMLGIVDSLFFLPVILSMIGPPAELISHAHPDRLPTPTPPASPQSQSHHNQIQNIQLQPMVRYHQDSFHRSPSCSKFHLPGQRHSKRSSRPEPPSSQTLGITNPCNTSGYVRHHSVNNHGGSNLSLSTITEEPPSSHSTNSCQSSYSGHSAHEIVVEPQVVVETTTYGNNSGGNGAGCRNTESSSGDTSNIGHVTTKVTATAKVKVELHTPLTSSSVSSCGSSRSSTSGNSSRKKCNSNATTTTPRNQNGNNNADKYSVNSYKYNHKSAKNSHHSRTCDESESGVDNSSVLNTNSCDLETNRRFCSHSNCDNSSDVSSSYTSASSDSSIYSRRAS